MHAHADLPVRIFGPVDASQTTLTHKPPRCKVSSSTLQIRQGISYGANRGASSGIDAVGKLIVAERLLQTY